MSPVTLSQDVQHIADFFHEYPARSRPPCAFQRNKWYQVQPPEALTGIAWHKELLNSLFNVLELHPFFLNIAGKVRIEGYFVALQCDVALFSCCSENCISVTEM